MLSPLQLFQLCKGCHFFEGWAYCAVVSSIVFSKGCKPVMCDLIGVGTSPLFSQLGIKLQ